jgi:WD40 repeat protein
VSAPAVEGTAAAGAVRRTPYQGLVPYSEADADWFFGRDEWCEVVGDNLRAYRITVLYGTSGVGKSSVLRAGLLRRLADEARGNAADFGVPRLLPVVFSAWSLDDPLAALKEAVAAVARDVAPALANDSPGSLADALELWPERIEGPLLLVLDQFEEFFLYHDHPGDSALDEVAAALRRRNPSVHFLLSIREDSLAKLDRFKGHVAGLLDHLLRIDHLDRNAAREAVVLPLERWSEQSGEEVAAEDDLVEAVLDQVTAGRVSLAEAGAGTATPARGAAEGIVAPYLQLVLERLWAEEHRRWTAQGAEEPRLLRLQALTDLGGAEKIVSTHLDAALAALPQREQDVAGKVFRQLVTPSGTKIALRVSDLADLAGLPEAGIEPLVAQLTGDVRILRGAGEGRYEIYHDALAGPILDWSARWQERQRRRRERRRLAILGGVAAVLAGIAALIAVFFIQARHAQRAARVGQSQALAGQAVASLDSDPAAGLRLATQAGETSPTGDAEGALRAALTADPLRNTLHAHTGTVFDPGAAFSPYGKLVVTADAGGTEVWDVASGRLRQTLGGHAGASDDHVSRSAVFSRDGTLVVTDSEGKTPVRIWDVVGGRLLHTLGGDRGAFSPNGKLVVTAGYEKTAIWDVASGKRLHTLTSHQDVRSAVFSPDGKRVVTADFGGAAVWDVASGGRLHVLYGRRLQPFACTEWYGCPASASAAFSPDGKRIVTASDLRPSRIWDVATGRMLHSLGGRSGQADGHDTRRAAFSPDGKLVVASSGQVVHVWDVASGRPLRTFTEPSNRCVRSALFSPNSKLVVAVSGSCVGGLDGVRGRARVWDVASGRNLHTLSGDISSAAFSPDGQVVVSASADGTAQIWDVASRPSLHTLIGHTDRVNNAAFSPDGKLVVTASDDGTARLWDTPSGRSLRTLKGNIASAAFSPDGKLVVTAGNRTARIWDVTSGRSLRKFTDPANCVDTAAFSPNAKLVVAASNFCFAQFTSVPGTTRIWDVASGHISRTLRGHTDRILSAAFSPDGKLVVTASFDGTARVWDMASGRSRHALVGHTGPVEDAAFSSDGKLVVTASDDKTARIWDAATGRSLRTLRGHTRPVKSAAFSRDGKFVVTAGEDGTARIWDVASGRELDMVEGHEGSVNSAAFSPDGKLVVTAGDDKTARIWMTCGVCSLSLEQLLVRAKARLAAIG